MYTYFVQLLFLRAVGGEYCVCMLARVCVPVRQGPIKWRLFFSVAPPSPFPTCAVPRRSVCVARGEGEYGGKYPPPFQQQQGATAALYPPGLVTSLGPTCHRTARQGFYGGPWGKGRGEGDFLREGGIWLSRQQGQAKEFDIFAVKCSPTWC